MGSPLENKAIIPVIDIKAAEFVQELIDDALAKSNFSYWKSTER